MTLYDFVLNWVGKHLEVSGGGDALNQCVDLVNGYIRDVLGLPIIEYCDAKDFPSKIGKDYVYIKNTPDNNPSQGDIIVWNSNMGQGHGHIAICLNGDVNGFTSFDQNFSKVQTCTIESHNYNLVDGWMRPINLPEGTYVDKKTFEHLVANSTLADSFVNAGFNTPKDAQDTIQKYLNDKNTALHDLEVLEGQYSVLQDQIKQLTQAPSPSNDLKQLIKPLVNGGWLIYLRSRGAIQKLVNV